MPVIRDEAKAHPVVEQLDALTSLRFFAAMYVLMFHYGSVPGSIFDIPFSRVGYTGVTFFFILSGFILAHNYHQVDFSKPGNLYRYFVARLSRIYPVYLLSLLLGVPLLLVMLGKMGPGSMATLAASSLLLAPLGLHAWVPGASCALDCPSWSLSVEFCFYVMLPLLLAPILRNPIRWLVLTLSAWLVLCGVYSWVWDAVATDGSILLPHLEPRREIAAQWIKYFPLGRLPEFCLGLVLYSLWKERLHRLDPAWMLSAFFVMAAILVVYAKSIPEIFLHNGLSAAAWVPLILSAASMTGGLLSSPIFVFLGRISFSLYLLHIPIFSGVLALDNRALGQMLVMRHPTSLVLLTTGLVIASAALVFLWVEEPFRRRVARFATRVWDGRR